MSFESFLLGADDLSGRLLIPDKLYGREREVDALLAFSRNDCSSFGIVGKFDDALELAEQTETRHQVRRRRSAATLADRPRSSRSSPTEEAHGQHELEERSVLPVRGCSKPTAMMLGNQPADR